MNFWRQRQQVLLSGATDGLRRVGSPPTAVEIVTVKFASTDTATGGAAMFDGGVYADGVRVGTDEFFYAGVLDGTNLGAPITETITAEANVKWAGQIRAVSTSGNGTLDAGKITDFGLNITFDATRETKGTINTSFSVGLGFAYSIDGTFDENGIIGGLVAFGAGNAGGLNTGHSTYAPGTLTGIIGQNGAVGVFHSDNANPEAGSGASRFSGGFIARPPDPCVKADTCVDTAAWLGSFTGGDALTTTPNTTTRENEFLQATATGFNTGANADIRATFGSPTEDIAIQTLPFDDTTPATGGVAFFGGELYSGEAGSETGTGNDFYYAGILAGTNLGAPITETITSARWTGQVRAVASESEGTLTANPTAGFGVDITFDGTGGTMKTSFANLGFIYSIDGTFDDKGIIEGDVAFGQPSGADTRLVDTSDDAYSPGTLTGIIGQNGAVGVFHSDNDNSATGDNPFVYSGGFFVTP